ncbi:MAG TPA: hypothetical protein VFA28_13870 [Bryobacteraceae bacterium]|jgi:hypothetical protein|nr:hypothetical protein [Bryobacteraceae bacterium]
MLTIGLVSGGEYLRYCALDADGRIVAEGTEPGAERGLRQRFGSLPPSIFSIEYNPAQCPQYATLAGLGHMLYFSGPAPEWMMPAFAASARTLARQNGGPLWVVTRHIASDGSGLRFTLAIDAAGNVNHAWYFIGPVGPGALPALHELRPDGGRGFVPTQRGGPERADCTSPRDRAWRMAELLRHDCSCRMPPPARAVA